MSEGTSSTMKRKWRAQLARASVARFAAAPHKRRSSGKDSNMSSLSISVAWDQTKAILGHDGRLFATVALALIVLPEVVFAVVGVPIGTQATALSAISYLIVVLLGFVGQFALDLLAIWPSVTVGGVIVCCFARLSPVFVVVVIVM